MNSTYVSFSGEVKFIEAERMVAAGSWGEEAERGWGLVFNGNVVAFWGRKKELPEMHSGDGYTTM